MSKVVVAEFVSLDGVMEAPDQWQLSIDETVLRLVDTKAFDSGVVALNLQPAG